MFKMHNSHSTRLLLENLAHMSEFFPYPYSLEMFLSALQCLRKTVLNDLYVGKFCFICGNKAR